MLARIITNLMIAIGGGIGGAAVTTHPKANWGESATGAMIVFIGMVFRGLAEKSGA